MIWTDTMFISFTTLIQQTKPKQALSNETIAETVSELSGKLTNSLSDTNNPVSESLEKSEWISKIR